MNKAQRIVVDFFMASYINEKTNFEDFLESLEEKVESGEWCVASAYEDLPLEMIIDEMHALVANIEHAYHEE